MLHHTLDSGSYITIVPISLTSIAIGRMATAAEGANLYIATMTLLLLGSSRIRNCVKVHRKPPLAAAARQYTMPITDSSSWSAEYTAADILSYHSKHQRVHNTYECAKYNYLMAQC